MELNEALEKFYSIESKLSAYNHAMALIYYDGATTAPKATVDNRVHALGILGEESYRISTSDETVKLLELLDSKKDELSEKDKRAVYVSLKSIRDMKKIPIDEYVAYQQLCAEADDVWHRAKENNDFASFCPLLTEIFETNKRFAAYVAPEKKPYDYCLDNYEEGLTMEKCDAFFTHLKSKLVPLIKKISESPRIDASCLYGSFDIAKQEKLSYTLMQIMDIDLSRCGLGTTEHPFTTSIGSHKDVRITTNYSTESYASSLYSVMHEGGHALYDMNSADDLAYTVLDGGVSMAIHESQSRFYENLIGRSRLFVELIYPKIKELFPEATDGVTSEDLYRAINLVTPSLIRTEADEVTYCLHVMVRYELEKKIMSGELEVKDLPREWNRLYKEYLGVDVPSDTEGVLQDSHWAGGGIGYFPSYALGSAYGAHFMAKMKETVDVDGCLKEGNLKPINEWNREKIWSHGCMYPSSELLARVLGEEFDPSYYTDYLEKKYGEIYGF